jgi:hypothetical protein
MLLFDSARRRGSLLPSRARTGMTGALDPAYLDAAFDLRPGAPAPVPTVSAQVFSAAGVAKIPSG